MALENINEDLLNSRYISLPQRLKDALDSVDIRNKIVQLAQALGLEEEGRVALETIVGVTFMGFATPDMLPEELAETFGMEKDAAEALANWLTKEIFASYLPDIQKMYTPGVTLVPANTPAAPAALPKTVPVPAPLPAAASLPAMPQIPAPAPSSPQTAPAGAPSGAAAAPRPFILRKETAPAPAAPQFKLNIDPKLFAPAKTVSAGVPLPPKPAQLEFGDGSAKKAEEKSIKIEADGGSPRVVHYTDFRTKNIGIPAAPLPVTPAAAATPDAAAPKPAVPKFTFEAFPKSAAQNPGTKAVDTVSPPQPAAKPSAPNPLNVPSWNSGPLPPAPKAPAPAGAPSAPPKVVNFTAEGEKK